MKHDDASPPAPPEAVALFPADRWELAGRYADLLATDGVVRGLIGPREAPRLWERHLINCALLGRALPANARVADIGSGAGLPGLVLAIARPDLSITLIEPLLRRTTFLEEVVAALGLDNVRVVRGRADALHGAETFDVVTSRAVAPLDRLLGWSMPLVAPRGALVAMKGSSVGEEVEAAADVLRDLGCAPPVVEVIALTEPPVSADPAEVAAAADTPGTHPQIHVVRVTWADPARVSLPARAPRASRGSSRGARNRRMKS